MTITESNSVPIADAEAHLRHLVASGWSQDQIARAARCSTRLVYKILTGQAKRTSVYLNGLLLAADPSRHYRTRDGLFPSVGTVRRGRALAAIGHSHQSIGEALGMHPVLMARLLNRPMANIWAERAFAMTALYELWSRTPGPSKRTATTAAQRGWHTPQAWEGSDLDDPEAQPNAVTRLDAVGIARERSKEIRLLASAGAMPEQIAQRIGITEQSVRDHLLAKYRPLYLELTA